MRGAPAQPPHEGMVLIALDGHECERCEHQWVPLNKTDMPKVCPKCKSPYWNTPRRGLTRQLVVRVDEATYSALAEAAERNGRTVAQSVRNRLRDLTKGAEA